MIEYNGYKIDINPICKQDYLYFFNDKILCEPTSLPMAKQYIDEMNYAGKFHTKIEGLINEEEN